MVSLCATLLWDVMNADLLVVHHAHDSGLASTLNEHLDSLASVHVSLRNVLYSTPSHSNMLQEFSVGSQLEACRNRTTAGFDERDIERHNPPLGCNPWYPYIYLLRIINCSSLVFPSTWNECHLLRLDP